MDYNLLYEESKHSLSPSKQEGYKQFCVEAYKTFGDSEETYQNKNLINQFFINKTSMGKTTFHLVKLYVKTFYNYLYSKELVDKEIIEYIDQLTLQQVSSENELETMYFHSLDECLDFLISVCRMHNLYLKDDMINIKVMAILAWYGLSLDDISALRKDDIKLNTILVNGKPIAIEGRFMDIIKRYCVVTEYHVFPQGKLQRLMASEYLMRSELTEQLSPNAVSGVLKRANKTLIKYGKKISIPALKRNHIFTMLLEYKDQERVIRPIMDFLGCDKSFAFGYKETYYQWLKRYYPLKYKQIKNKVN